MHAILRKACTAVGTVGLATALTLASGGSAQADEGVWHNFTLEVEGRAKFTGKYKFNPSSTGHGGFVVQGSVCDLKADGDGVYGQGQVEGYGWSSKRGDANGSASGCGSENREIYDPQAIYVDRGRYQICVDDLGSDTCATQSWKYR
ncbi:hypothetical protein [Streptomyces lanatus]|uniref:Secreted protein n=1 Tax=Streptomyces lanatus TaxID=66900 RepID=A0ABV1XIT3_9ACTN|nr:hypothetical protein [Streptomyces lanatus]GHG92065.1 hypothetical protein GCM10018780_13290 [Streptomyces lanatus]